MGCCLQFASGCDPAQGQHWQTYNPLLQLRLEDALATINAYLSSDIK